ncbi:hypothetical protein JOF48_002264 [Arthrobacter stackebrandtii]|uniref:DUF1449 family protein n=1 Tax=Arthrobacter stackebrandtii TaxID=272161 RepID=A0ABS4YYC9_9MICC|nr:hypothetical protein [Arthrobacter stackebrandtii]MBP2413465.1 hypothetical protein [Arthrobacter stackebrandtii]PYH00687.1 hypothetical protein CVV67_09235 [Arthrobacter stackebrandtii]
MIPQSTSNLLGISLRPWAGMSPAKLALRGLVHTAIGIFLVYWCLRIAAGGLETDTAELSRIAGTVRVVAVPLAILFIVFTLYGLLRVAVGVLDLVPRHEVTGTVVMAGARQFGDVLPRFVQDLVFRRGRDYFGSRNDDTRRTRHQIVVETLDGLKTYTVNPGMALSVRQGQQVRLSVSPLIGYVAKCQVL